MSSLEPGPLVAWIAAGIAVVSLLSNLAQWQLGRKRSVLTYQLLLDHALFPEAASETWADLKLTHGQSTVEKARWVVIQVRNAGTEPVTKENFTEPIELTLPGSAVGRGAIVAASLAKIRDNGQERPMPVDLVDPFTIRVDGANLNRGDALNFQLLVDGEREVEIYAEATGFKWVEARSSVALEAALTASNDVLRAALPFPVGLISMAIGPLSARIVRSVKVTR